MTSSCSTRMWRPFSSIRSPSTRAGFSIRSPRRGEFRRRRESPHERQKIHRASPPAVAQSAIRSAVIRSGSVSMSVTRRSRLIYSVFNRFRRHLRSSPGVEPPVIGVWFKPPGWRESCRAGRRYHRPLAALVRGLAAGGPFDRPLAALYFPALHAAGTSYSNEVRELIPCMRFEWRSVGSISTPE